MALAALALPPEALRRWLERNRAFCERHGGRRVYGEIIDLLEHGLAAAREAAR